MNHAQTDKNTVLAQYVFRMAGRTPTAWEQKGVAVAGYTAAVIRKHTVAMWM